MSIQSIVESGLREENIEYYASLPFDECKIINTSLVEKSFGELKPRSVIIFLAPYFSGRYPERNVSLYAIPRDYHLFFREIFISIENNLLRTYPNNIFKGFTDHSPINEVDAATKAGLGIIGENGLLINEKYGSFVFIGEILTDLDVAAQAQAVGACHNCGKCRIVCPSYNECLSAITQKRGVLTDREQQMIRAYGIAWGCDVCQLICPHNADVAETPVQFFREDLIPNVPPECEIVGRAYAWRGKGCIHRNLDLLKKG
ncbi:MAG: hypothetical protein FWF15_07160 [Oscillospiraceae bacterium]|nr:hypothetical protein [Oscillospiraceae bacterium]